MARTSLLEQICAMDNLTVAWRKVRANIAVARRARSCGVDEVSVATFEQNWEANLAELRRAMLDGSYQPLPARQVVIGKVGGGQRTIGVLAVRDRIAQRAAHQRYTACCATGRPAAPGSSMPTSTPASPRWSTAC